MWRFVSDPILSLFDKWQILTLWTLCFSDYLALNSDYKIIWRYFLLSIVLNLVVFCTSFFSAQTTFAQFDKPQGRRSKCTEPLSKMIDFAWNYLIFCYNYAQKLLVFACNTWSNVRKNSQLGRYLANSSFIGYCLFDKTCTR